MQLALQLYTLREQMEVDPSGTLRAVADMGLEWVELAGTYGKSPGEFAAMLKDAGLRACSAHIGLDRLQSDMAGALEELNAVGAGFAAVPWVDLQAHDDTSALANQLTTISDELAESGIELSYHNHAGELEGAEPTWLDRLFEAAHAGPLKAQLDLGWIQAAGKDPVSYIQRYANRLPTVHLKDFSGDRENPDAIAGKGKLDWPKILESCKTAAVQFGILEMDNPGADPLTSVRNCVDFFRTQGV